MHERGEGRVFGGSDVVRMLDEHAALEGMLRPDGRQTDALLEAQAVVMRRAAGAPTSDLRDVAAKLMLWRRDTGARPATADRGEALLLALTAELSVYLPGCAATSAGLAPSRPRGRDRASPRPSPIPAR